MQKLQAALIAVVRVAIFFAVLGFFFGWGPLRGLNQYWAGEPDRPVVARDDQTTLTLDNFEAKFRDHLNRSDYAFRRINCVADSFNPGGTQCAYQFNIGENGATLFIKSGPASRAVTYAGFMIGNPAVFQEPIRSETTRFYELLAERVASLVAPEIGLEARNAMIQKLQSGIGATHQEASACIGEWTYGAGSGLIDWSFHAQRK